MKNKTQKKNNVTRDNCWENDLQKTTKHARTDLITRSISNSFIHNILINQCILVLLVFVKSI